MPTEVNQTYIRAASSYLTSLQRYAYQGTGFKLRRYQLEAGDAIIRSVRDNLGLAFVLVLPRQSGKDELLAHLTSFLMRSLSFKDRGIVMVNPTYKPQTINSIMRLETRLNMNPLTYSRWKKRSDFIRQIGYCKTTFLSGDGEANVVGATASLLLLINEAQDIDPAVYDHNFAPMCASTNATRVFCGTVWTSNTLLARQIRQARAEEKQDGARRLFMYDADCVARVHKPYGKYVQGEIKRLGRQNPMIKTQYFNEEIDSQISLFNPARLALMQGDQPAYDSPPVFDLNGGWREAYAFLIDVAGQDERAGQFRAATAPADDMSHRHSDLSNLANPGRDSTTLSIVSIDLSTLSTLQAPTYRVIHRLQWTGVNHLTVFGQLKALAEAWNPQHIVMDSTGVGEGLWALMDRAFPSRVIPVKFTQQTKSEIGWRFLAIIETGRLRLCSFPDSVRLQYVSCESEILPGPGKTMRWSVPEGKRGPDGFLIHDDHLLADALVARLDELEWMISRPSVIIHSTVDPLAELERHF